MPSTSESNSIRLFEGVVVVFLVLDAPRISIISNSVARPGPQGFDSFQASMDFRSLLQTTVLGRFRIDGPWEKAAFCSKCYR